MLKEETKTKVSHVVSRPGRKHGDADVTIPVAEALTTVPGIPQKEEDVAFYSRVYPIESQNIEKAADREWVWTVYTEDILKYRTRHDELNEPLVNAAAVSGKRAIFMQHPPLSFRCRLVPGRYRIAAGQFKIHNCKMQR